VGIFESAVGERGGRKSDVVDDVGEETEDVTVPDEDDRIISDSGRGESHSREGDDMEGGEGKAAASELRTRLMSVGLVGMRTPMASKMERELELLTADSRLPRPLRMVSSTKEFPCFSRWIFKENAFLLSRMSLWSSLTLR
jgi:hypothetical protein